MIDQTAAHLREGFQNGRWVGRLPGVLQLASELMISKDIVRATLKVLEEEGWIEDCGAGRSRRIVADRAKMPTRRSLRIAIMLYEPLDGDATKSVQIVLGIRHAIESSGHSCIIGHRSLSQMNGNLARISRLVKATEADAWIVFAASRPVMEWFVAQPTPVLAYGGRFHGLPVASTATLIAPAIEAAMNALTDQGHRRIVMLAPTVLRRPTPIPSLEKYLSLLEARGIAVNDYHLPHYEETPEGLENCLHGLFRITPPTALLVLQSDNYVPVISFLARRGLQVPGDVSVICTGMESSFQLCLPPLDHFYMPVKEHVARIARWVNGVAKGRPDQRQVTFDAVYVPGGTVGPAKK